MLPLLAAAIGIAGLVLVVTFWDEIVNWLGEIIPKVREVFAKHYANIAHATAIFVQKIKGKVVRVIHRLFFKQDNKWFRESRFEEVEESEVPEWVKQRIGSKEVDKTEDFRRELPALEL